MYKNKLKSELTIAKYGDAYCGFSKDAETFLVTMSVEAKETDKNGFVVDAQVFDNFVRYELSGQSELSGENIAKQIAEAFFHPDEYSHIARVEVTVNSSHPTMKEALRSDLSFEMSRPAKAPSIPLESALPKETVEQVERVYGRKEEG